MAGFRPGETATVRDLLYGVLLPSGAECCEALAREVSGSEEAFVELMNQKAAALGMASTHFCNPTGLHDPEHVSTARDMARLLRAAMQNEMFRTIFATARYTVPPTNLHPDGFTLESTFWSELDGTELFTKITESLTADAMSERLAKAMAAFVDTVNYVVAQPKKEFVIPDKIEEFDIRNYV